MRITTNSAPHGIALIIVMLSIVVLGILAGGFAYSMKVETKLARNASYDTELEWMGRSGVEYARWVLGQPKREPFDSLNQIWAGGPGSMDDTNSPLAGIRLSEPVELGSGRFWVKIVDCERKININLAAGNDPNNSLLQRVFAQMGVDAAESPAVLNSILDWIDRDDMTRVGGAESDYYQGFTPPYYAKNGPIDDITELLLVKGVTQELFWGPACTNHSPAAFQVKVNRFNLEQGPPSYPIGLVDIFTPVSSGRVNINTARPEVLEMIPMVDQFAAAEIVRQRAGPDGVEGTEDDTPWRNVGELVNVIPSNQVVAQLGRYCDVRSSTFEVHVTAEISGYQRRFVALLARTGARDTQVLSFALQ